MKTTQAITQILTDPSLQHLVKDVTHAAHFKYLREIDKRVKINKGQFNERRMPETDKKGYVRCQTRFWFFDFSWEFTDANGRTRKCYKIKDEGEILYTKTFWGTTRNYAWEDISDFY